MKKRLFFTAFVLMLCCGFSVGTANAQTFPFPYTFSAQDLYGKPVTEKSLGEKELFFVHYWGTWCPPCVAEMPNLAAVSKKYGNRVGFIALVDDYSDNRAAAVRITERSGASFVMVDAEHGDFRKLLQMLQSGYVPTTILIGKDGKIIGEQIIGAYGEGYGNFIEKALN